MVKITFIKDSVGYPQQNQKVEYKSGETHEVTERLHNAFVNDMKVAVIAEKVDRKSEQLEDKSIFPVQSNKKKKAGK